MESDWNAAIEAALASIEKLRTSVRTGATQHDWERMKDQAWREAEEAVGALKR